MERIEDGRGGRGRWRELVGAGGGRVNLLVLIGCKYDGDTE